MTGRKPLVSLATVICGLGYVNAVLLIFWATDADERGWAVSFAAAVGAMTLGAYCSWLDADGR